MKHLRAAAALLLALLLLVSLAGCFMPPLDIGYTPDPVPANDSGLVELPAEEPEKAPETPAVTEDVPDEPEETPAETPEEPPVEETPAEEPPAEPEPELPEEDGSFCDRDGVAAYIRAYGHLPANYMTKKDAEAKGWSGGSLDKVVPGKSIGGDRFGNYEGLLPKQKGRTYYECDIDTEGKSSRGAKRIIFSNDGLIFYTDDHYESFSESTGDGTWK